MAIKLTLTIEMYERRTLEKVLETLADALESHKTRLGERAVKIAHEVQGPRGKTKLSEDALFKLGEPIDLGAFGIPKLTPLEELLEAADSPEAGRRRARERVLDALDDLRPEPGSSISSVELTNGAGEGVRLTAGEKVVEFIGARERERI